MPGFLLAKTAKLQYTLNTMETQIQAKLFEINQIFYDRFASSFSATRGRVQPGVQQLSRQIDPDASVLDVGCGNGTLARALQANNFHGKYLGIDMSEGLLSAAEALMEKPSRGVYSYRQIDLAQIDWYQTIPKRPFDCLLSFAVLHHLPGNDFRQQTVQSFSKLVSPQSMVAVSVWQWQNSHRLRKRVLPWSMVDLNLNNLDEGDVLLDWRAGDTPGVRYVHTFDEASLSALAESAGFRVSQSFYSDGKSGDLALYQVWQLIEN